LGRSCTSTASSKSFAGDDVPVAKVDPSGDFGGRHFHLHRLRGAQHVLGEVVRDVVLADDHFDVHAGIADHAQDLDHASAGEMRGAVGIPVDLDVHHLAVARVERGVVVDEDVGVDADVEWHDVRFGAGVKAADHGTVRAAEDAHDLAVDVLAVADAAALGGPLVHPDDHQVAVHGAFHVAALDIDVRLAVSPQHVAVAVVVDLDRTGVIRRELEQRVTLAANSQDQPFLLELLDGAVDVFAMHVVVLQPLEDLLDAEDAVAALAKESNDRLVQDGALREGQRACQSRLRLSGRCARTCPDGSPVPRRACGTRRGGAPDERIRRIRSAWSACAACCGECSGGRPVCATPG
jgi:hypothetical protein